jgi:hypothetical protein
MNGAHVVVHVHDHGDAVGPQDIDHLWLQWVCRSLDHHRVSVLGNLHSDQDLLAGGLVKLNASRES